MTDTIGGRIAAALAEKNMTRKELVEKSGVRDRNIRRYINGENIPNLSKILEMAEALDVKPSWLSGFEQKDFCNLYKKEEAYELYEICPCEFCAHELKDEIVLEKQDKSIERYRENNCNENIEFGRKIEQMLNISAMMIKDLAGKTGIHPDQITAYKNCRRNPSLPTVETFAEALQVSPSWLAGFIDVDTRNTYVMQDNPEETIYIHPSQYVITKIEDDGNKITLKKIQKE